MMSIGEKKYQYSTNHIPLGTSVTIIVFVPGLVCIQLGCHSCWCLSQPVAQTAHTGQFIVTYATYYCTHKWEQAVDDGEGVTTSRYCDAAPLTLVMRTVENGDHMANGWHNKTAYNVDRKLCLSVCLSPAQIQSLNSRGFPILNVSFYLIQYHKYGIA